LDYDKIKEPVLHTKYHSYKPKQLKPPIKKGQKKQVMN